ncbi:MAG TPA: prepilin-type N-terminal cleavage/methylation domain-containing protein, partial [Planctomycetaceae bacterium]|nr:prepilin-type N-terminal cleavage/methylation domain-containing protein [Planctomycetaceae bacterium]
MQTREAQSKRFRPGYTLVEMVVAVALVTLIMVLLAQVFGLATGSMEKHRATSANDQQARTFVSILKGDLCARSFWEVYPFHHSNSTTGPPPTFSPGP